MNGRRLVCLVPALVSAATMTACSPDPSGGSDTPASAPTSTSSAAATSTSAGFENPVLASNFPDPHILADGAGNYLAFATNGNGMNVQTATSADMVTWQQSSDALPTLPSWSIPGKVWAPEAIAWPDGSYRLYYTTALAGEDRQCLSVAVADKAAGPYTDSSTEPLLCEIDEGGSIDSTPFLARDGTAYLLWKNDGNHVGVDTWIRAAKLAPDGMSVIGKTYDVLKQDQPWEDMLIEGPSLWEHNGTVHLFYSGNGFWTDKYAVGHATATSPTGPFVKDDQPVLVGNEVAAGPGHNSLIEVGGQLWMVYHAWEPGFVGDDSVGRQMWLSRVTFGQGTSVSVEPPMRHHPTLPEGGHS